MKKYLPGIFSLLLSAYLVVAVIWSRNQAEAAVCRGINIIVNDSLNSHFVTSREIAGEIGNLPERACALKLTDINTDSIEKILDKVDKIESATCIVTTDNRIIIEIDPLHPVARIFDGSKSYYINKDGKRISATARYHTDVPVIYGSFDSIFTPKSLLPLVNYIAADSTWNSLITYIKAENPRNIILVPMIHGHVINIGDMTDLNNKFYRLRRAYKEILPVTGWDYYDTLSVKWQGQLVATRRVKQLHTPISAVDLDAEQELPDIGTMLVDDTVRQSAKAKAVDKPLPKKKI
jgi:cell division protein FtsQ